MRLFAIQGCCFTNQSKVTPEVFLRSEHCNEASTVFEIFVLNTHFSKQTFLQWLSILDDTVDPPLVLVVTALWMWNSI